MLKVWQCDWMEDSHLPTSITGWTHLCPVLYLFDFSSFQVFYHTLKVQSFNVGRKRLLSSGGKDLVMWSAYLMLGTTAVGTTTVSERYLFFLLAKLARWWKLRVSPRHEICGSKVLELAVHATRLALISLSANQYHESTSHLIQGHGAAASSENGIPQIFIVAEAYRLVVVLPDEPGTSMLRTCSPDFG